MASITRLLPVTFLENGRFLNYSNYWPKLRGLHQEILRRGMKTDSPVEELPDSEADDEDRISREEARIRKIRDTSRLKPHHRNIANGMVPSDEKTLPHHFTVLYNKRLFGRYGYASGVDPALCWPVKEDLEDKKEYERVAYPYTILEVAGREAAKREQLEREKWQRDEQTAANVKAMLKMKDEYLKRLEKKREDDAAAKAFKQRLIEEVRLHFNYMVNERDERFKLEVRERAKQLREKEKLEKKALRKEKLAIEKQAKTEEANRKLKEKEEQRKLKIGSSEG